MAAAAPLARGLSGLEDAAGGGGGGLGSAVGPTGGVGAAWVAARIAELLLEVGLAPGSGLLRALLGRAPVAPRAQRREPVRDAGGEAGRLLDRRLDREADRADGLVDGLDRVDRAVGRLVELVELVVHAVDGAADLVDHGQQLALGPADEREGRRWRTPPSRKQTYAMPRPVSTRKTVRAMSTISSLV